MPIPTLHDVKLGEIDDAMAGVMVTLRVMRRADPRDLARMREGLRGQLQDLVNAVMALADAQLP